MKNKILHITIDGDYLDVVESTCHLGPGKTRVFQRITTSRIPVDLDEELALAILKQVVEDLEPGQEIQVFRNH